MRLYLHQINLLILMFMRKLFLAFIALFTMASVSAQSVKFGFTGDMNISKIQKNDDNLLSKAGFEPASDLGWAAGLKMKAIAPFGLGVDLAVKYSQESVDYENNATEKANMKGKVSYITLPLHVRYDVAIPVLSEALVPYLFAGPQFSYNVKDIEWDYENMETNLSSVKEFLNNQIKTPNTDWKLDLGFGITLAEKLEISYTYAIPMTNSFEAKNATGLLDEANANYKIGTHKIGLAIYF